MHVIQNRNITHALPIPVNWETDFTPKWVDVSRSHDTVARFRNGVKFSPREKNRGELHLRWSDLHRHDILWWYHVNKYRAMRGNQSELAPWEKSPQCHVNTPFKLHIYFIHIPVLFTCRIWFPSDDLSTIYHQRLFCKKIHGEQHTLNYKQLYIPHQRWLNNQQLSAHEPSRRIKLQNGSSLPHSHF